MAHPRSSTLPLTKPWCAVCQRPVKSIDAATNYSTDELLIAVSCHGKTEIVAVSLRDVGGLDLPPGAIRTDGIAFRPTLADRAHPNH